MWLNDHSQGRRLELKHLSLREADLSLVKLKKAVLFDCDLRGARFCPSISPDIDEDDISLNQLVSLEGADLRYSDLSNAILAPEPDAGGYLRRGMDVSNTNFAGCSGFFGSEPAYLGKGLYASPTSPPKFQLWWPNTTFGDLPSWEWMRILGRFPIFTTSNVVFAAIIAYAGIARWYNEHIDRIKSFETTEAAREYVDFLASVLSPAPSPSHLGHLLLVFLSLTLANIIYRVKCPQYVQELSRHFALDESHNKASYAFLSGAYSARLSRYLCFLLMISSGLYLAIYVLRRIYFALMFFYPDFF